VGRLKNIKKLIFFIRNMRPHEAPHDRGVRRVLPTPVLAIALLTRVRFVSTISSLRSRKWQLIDMS